MAHVDEMSEASSSESSSSSSRKNYQPKKKNCKIRTRNVNKWKDSNRKALKNAGKKYTSRSGYECANKVLKPPCNCPKKCIEKVSQDQREMIFKQFWDMADHERQWEFIVKSIKEEKPKRIKASGSRRVRTNTYFLLIDTLEPVVVCKTMFVNTLSISEQVTSTALIKHSMNEANNLTYRNDPGKRNTFKMADLRGRHKNRPHKLPDSLRESVKDHINSLMPIDSRYCHKNSTKLSYTLLHREYLLWYNVEKYGDKRATLRQYSDIVKGVCTEFGA